MKNRMVDGTKLLWHMDRVIKHFDVGERVAPIHIDWGLSKFCDTNCIYCFGAFQNPKRDYIKKDALLRSISEAGEIGVKSIAFIGDGEPLLNPHVYEALGVGRSSGISMALSTSGISLDSEYKRDVVLSCCNWMRFSLSAGDADGYKRIHRVNKFDRLVSNIKSLVERKSINGYSCDIGLQAVFVPGVMNEDMIKEAELAVNLGVDYFLIKQCSLPEGNKTVGDVKFEVSEYDKEQTVRALKKAESLSNERTKIIVKWGTMARKGARLYDNCPAVPLISEISGNGDWFPCGYFFGEKPKYDKYRFGNLHKQSLKEIYESDRYWEIIKYFRERFNSHTECMGSCRLDSCNKFVSDYLNKPSGINFI